MSPDAKRSPAGNEGAPQIQTDANQQDTDEVTTGNPSVRGSKAGLFGDPAEIAREIIQKAGAPFAWRLAAELVVILHKYESADVVVRMNGHGLTINRHGKLPKPPSKGQVRRG